MRGDCWAVPDKGHDDGSTTISHYLHSHNIGHISAIGTDNLL